MDDIFGERVFTENLEEVVLAGAPHGLLLGVITVPDDAKNSPVVSQLVSWLSKTIIWISGSYKLFSAAA